MSPKRDVSPRGKTISRREAERLSEKCVRCERHFNGACRPSSCRVAGVLNEYYARFGDVWIADGW